MAYSGVANIDESCKQKSASVATLLLGGTNIPGVSRCAIIQDLQWTKFSIFAGPDPKLGTIKWTTRPVSR